MKLRLQDILVVSDMDGTLLSSDHTLSACNLATIRLFTSLGGKFTVATGRVTESVGRYTEMLDYIAPAITSGGCTIYDFQQGKTIASALVPGAVARKAIRDVTNAFPSVGVVIMANDNKNYALEATHEVQKLFIDEKTTHFIRPWEDYPPEWNKVLFAAPPEVLDEVEGFVAKLTYPGVYFVRTSVHYFEIMPVDVSKGSALLQLCNLLDVNIENTYAIGDYFNDVEMMQAAGHAVAMENAPVEIQMMADEVTGNCNEGGVGQFLYKLIDQFEKE